MTGITRLNVSLTFNCFAENLMTFLAEYATNTLIVNVSIRDRCALTTAAGSACFFFFCDVLVFVRATITLLSLASISSVLQKQICSCSTRYLHTYACTHIHNGVRNPSTSAKPRKIPVMLSIFMAKVSNNYSYL